MEGKAEIDIAVIIIFGSLGMLTLVSFIVVFVMMYQKKVLAHKTNLQETENKHQRELLDATIEIAEQERKKIAANIHDDVGVTLNVIKLNFSKIDRNLNDKKIVGELLQNNANLLEETISSLRTISHDLMPPSLVKLGFRKGINEMCRQINATGIIEVVHIDHNAEINLSKKNELQLYRLVKEVVNNIIKHAAATKIEITLSVNNFILVTCVAHNGNGITNEMVKQLTESGGGLGLKSILSRAQLTNSTVHYSTQGKTESKIIIETPL